MKLATLKNGRPDGQLVVVSSDLRTYVSAGRIAPTLQAALDTWHASAPALAALSAELEAGRIAGQQFETRLALAPLPRAYQWIDGVGYLSNLERMSSVRGTGDEPLARQRPLIYQGASDSLASSNDPIIVPDGDLALDFEAEVAVIVGPVKMRADKTEAAAAIRLVTLCNDVSLRRLVADDLQNGLGLFHAKPATSFAPVVVTPDELGGAWSGNKLHMRVRAMVNDLMIGQPDAGRDMQFDFADLIVEAARTRTLGCGTIIGSGTVSNRHDEALPIKRDGTGFACIAEARMVEKVKYGRARTAYLKSGDMVRITALDTADREVFGAIEQSVSVLIQ
jgi:fumarylacetoacetate (FAA) hydrolase